MILITGGLGFIGTHTVPALLDRGEECVVLQRSRRELPAVLAGASVSIEQGDVADLETLRAIGREHRITGIVHLAVSAPWPPGSVEPIDGSRRAIRSMLNVVQVAQEWGVRRLSVASTIGVYGGVDTSQPLREDLPLSVQSAPVSIPTFKKISELLNGFLADNTGVEIVNLRISGTWGPLGHLPDPFFAGPSLVAAAARGAEPDLSRLLSPPKLDDGLDLTYVKDTGRAIAMLQLADRLNHRTYNVGSGRVTTNADVIDALRTVVPDARIHLPAGRSLPPLALDITRLREGTGYEPHYDTEWAVRDYVDWLRAGNPV